MSTLADRAIRDSCCVRLTRLNPSTKPRWGRMTAHQMVCHLNDSLAVGVGTRNANSVSGLLQRTVMKWIALYAPLRWPHGVPTVPEVEQGRGGTPPSDWARDCQELRQRISEFASQRKHAATHPFFGKMSRSNWLVWGFRHLDHHFRQFGV